VFLLPQTYRYVSYMLGPHADSISTAGNGFSSSRVQSVSLSVSSLSSLYQIGQKTPDGSPKRKERWPNTESLSPTEAKKSRLEVLGTVSRMLAKTLSPGCSVACTSA